MKMKLVLLISLLFACSASQTTGDSGPELYSCSHLPPLPPFLDGQVVGDLWCIDAHNVGLFAAWLERYELYLRQCHPKYSQ